MSGFVNLYVSRRQFHIKCTWYKAKKDNEKLVYDEQPSGYFYAKWQNAMRDEKDKIGNFLQINQSSLVLLTADDVTKMSPNDKVTLNGKEYRVVNTVSKMVKKQSEFDSSPAVYTYVELIGQ